MSPFAKCDSHLYLISKCYKTSATPLKRLLHSHAKEEQSPIGMMDVYGKLLSHLFDKPVSLPINLLYHFDNIKQPIAKLLVI